MFFFYGVGGFIEKPIITRFTEGANRTGVGLAPLLPVWVVYFPKTTTSRRPPEVGYETRRL